MVDVPNPEEWGGRKKRASDACVRSYFATPCPHHPGGAKDVHPELCGLQACESSSEQNTKERVRDAWDGTSEVAPRGLRHFGSVVLAVFIFTLPAELRALCVGDRLRAFRKAAGDLALEVLRARVGNARADFWCKSWFHPEGDEEPGVYKPHENVLVPLAWDDPGRKRGFKLTRAELPAEWFGAGGWVGERWRSELVRIFGQWWTGPAPAVDWFYKFNVDPGKKVHALEYFGRTFPRWAQHPAVPLRPRSFGLAHWKKRFVFREDGSRLDRLASVCIRGGDPLPPFDVCPTCLEEGVPLEEIPARVPVVGATQHQVVERMERALRAHTCARCQSPVAPGVELEPDGPYVQYRRSMGLAVEPSDQPKGPSPPPEWVDQLTGEVISGPDPGPAMEWFAFTRARWREAFRRERFECLS